MTKVPPFMPIVLGYWGLNPGQQTQALLPLETHSNPFVCLLFVFETECYRGA
jgi:hypothetical protein